MARKFTLHDLCRDHQIALLQDRARPSVEEVNAVSNRLETPLRAALSKPGGAEIVKLLLYWGARPNDQSEAHLVSVPLCLAAAQGDIEIVRALLEAGAQCAGTSGPVYHLVSSSSFDLKRCAPILHMLIAAGADVDSITMNRLLQRLPAEEMYAAVAAGDRAIKRYCQQARPDDGSFPQHLLGLIQASAGREVPTPILLQILHNRDVLTLPLLEGLLRCGIGSCHEFIQENSSNLTCGRVPLEVFAKLVSVSVEHLVPDAHYYGPDRHCLVNFCAAHCGACPDLRPIVERLCQLGADVNVSDRCGYFPLHEVPFGDTALVRLLVQHGADVNGLTESSSQYTPLQCAAMAGGEAVVSCLLELGADPEVSSPDFENAFSLALLHRENPDANYEQYSRVVARLQPVTRKTRVWFPKTIANSSAVDLRGFSCQFANDTEHIVAYNYAMGVAYVWNRTLTEPLDRVQLPTGTYCLVASPVAPLMAIAVRGKGVAVTTLDGKKAFDSWKSDSGYVFQMSFSFDGRSLAIHISAGTTGQALIRLQLKPGCNPLTFHIPQCVGTMAWGVSALHMITTDRMRHGLDTRYEPHHTHGFVQGSYNVFHCGYPSSTYQHMNDLFPMGVVRGPWFDARICTEPHGVVIARQAVPVRGYDKRYVKEIRTRTLPHAIYPRSDVQLLAAGQSRLFCIDGLSSQQLCSVHVPGLPTVAADGELVASCSAWGIQLYKLAPMRAWEPSSHRLRSQRFQAVVRTLLLMRLCDAQTGQPYYEHALWWMLPDDCLFEVIQYVAVDDIPEETDQFVMCGNRF
eukprot:TRINITY_DN4770_c0_g3_i1.p1 TRINITY_DN4770_c0_g3~~TRINITY_DN4770_c0_g3_i1.p1  ORF type:complete len:813 (+),score=101.67 TRINITY_DN4770_c0_g3_i1:45-2441(+)